MSHVLMIRHLPSSLKIQDKEQLLKHFGAENVWETSSKRNYIFASFGTVEKAKIALGRLHQLEIAKRRLVVEYSSEKETVTQSKPDTDQISATTKLVKDFLRVLNAWNPSVDFYQPPPVHLKYKYPEPNSGIAINILHALFKHKPFYIQTLHLMNKMCLDDPFKQNELTVEWFKVNFRTHFIDELLAIPTPKSDAESEISSDENEMKEHQYAPKLLKRKHKLPVPTRKRHGLMLPSVAPQKKRAPIIQGEVFENIIPVQEPKKISVIVPQDALQKPSEEPDVVGELGKFDKTVEAPSNEETNIEEDQPSIPKKELLQNRISYRDMKLLPVFKNYHPGEPSMRLYIKNLAKAATEQDVKRIYKRYVENLTDDEMTGFDVRVMQEGRMKGQGFVTFPTVRIAEAALHETNGYMLKDKPMVVQFARAANKKGIV